ncbi:hypothetical protein QE250_16105 [Chromatiaceae bacterium AAb-1]|nr:hypothetical protein [Chromatiaceae bacterium AAb-1]
MNNPLAGTDPTGYVSCAASKIEVVCDKTVSRWGGNGNADMTAFATSSGGASNQGNGAQSVQPSQGNAGGNTADIGSQANHPNGSSGSISARWVGDGITRTGDNTLAGTIHCDMGCRAQVVGNKGGVNYGSAAFLLGLAAADGPAPVGDALAIIFGVGVIIHNMSSDKPDPLISMRNAAGTGSPMPDPDDDEHDDRPPGVPTDWVKQAARKEGHVKWVDPKNPHNYVRVKRNGEVTQVRNGKALDKNGNEVRLNSPEAHGIKLKDFKFRG